MPRMNGSGPMGEGAMTGRRMGRCANAGTGMQNNDNEQRGNNQVKPDERSAGVGLGRGLGRGRGQQGNGMGRGRQGQGKGMGRGNRSNG